ncbi:MAG: bifunctional DNA-formamidopyrimidine glycosylase/DNA-(apurinic or apyrimidinic site) lyase [bacterium]
MPELPEVETTRRSLEPHVVGARISAVTVRQRRLRRPLDDDFELRLSGRTVAALERRGKYLLFGLDDGTTLLVHLGMSGALELMKAGTPLAVHDHVVLVFDRGLQMVFNDPRRFGLMRLGHGDDLAELRNVGRDSLSSAPSVDEWRALTRGRRLPIKSLLMDQRVLGGVGNIYASEMLFKAGVRPRRRAETLTRAELARLAEAMRAVLERAVELGGSSISDYRDANGNAGYFQIHHAVYDRDGQPCGTCTTPIKRIVQSGRSSFYCPRCQK